MRCKKWNIFGLLLVDHMFVHSWMLVELFTSVHFIFCKLNKMFCIVGPMKLEFQAVINYLTLALETKHRSSCDRVRQCRGSSISYSCWSHFMFDKNLRFDLLVEKIPWEITNSILGNPRSRGPSYLILVSIYFVQLTAYLAFC